MAEFELPAGQAPPRFGRRAALTGALSTGLVGLAGLAVASKRGPGAQAGEQPAAPTTRPRVDSTALAALPEIRTAATTSEVADRANPPFRVDWIGGSDVVWDGVSLPDSLAARVPSVGRRPVLMRARIRQALTAAGALEFVDQVVAEGTDAIMVSMNLSWLHWDEVSCGEFLVPYERYVCLLTTQSADADRRLDADMRALGAAAAAAGVPVFMYTHPQSVEVLADATLAPLIAAGEALMTTYDPGAPSVRFVGQTISRWIAPMREGIEFRDFVHPGPTGAEMIADWMAPEMSAWWTATVTGS